jgi:transposase
MTISREQETEIRRLYYAEHWPLGTIARQLGVHEDVVRRVLGRLGPADGPASAKFGLIAPYAAFLHETLERYPTLRATRLYDMIRDRGYAGSVRRLREYVATVRPQPKKTEAFIRLDPLIGEQAQIDWAYVGKFPVEGGWRALWAFIIVLAWSRAMWAELVFDLSIHSLLRSLVRAMTFLGGSARQWLFDNAKVVVLERAGDAARFHPLLLDLSGRYCAQLRLCAPRKPNQKGRVERAIRFLRERHLAGRTIRSAEHGNEDLLRFIEQIAHARPHPDFPERTVADCFTEERTRLLPLPSPTPATDQVELVSVDKLAFVHFDKNRYSVDPNYAEHTITLLADDRTVRLLDGEKEIGAHLRSFGIRQIIRARAHQEALVAQKQAARATTGRDRLRAVAPGIDTLVERWVEAGRNIGSMISQTLRLLDLYGDALFAEAVAEIVERGTHDPGALAVICERQRHARALPVPLDIPLAEHVPDRDVIPHDLEIYDGER